MNYKKIQKGSSLSSGIKLMNRNNTLPKRLKLWNCKNPNINSGAEEANKWDFFNVLESTGNRPDHMGDRISELEYRNLEMTQVGKRVMIFFFCSGFCHILKWNSHGFTCVPHPDPPSHLPLHPIPLGLPSAPGPSTCLMHPTWAGDLFHPR